MNLFNGSDDVVVFWTALGVFLLVLVAWLAVGWIARRGRRNAETMRRAMNVKHEGFYTDLH